MRYELTVKGNEIVAYDKLQDTNYYGKFDEKGNVVANNSLSLMKIMKAQREAN